MSGRGRGFEAIGTLEGMGPGGHLWPGRMGRCFSVIGVAVISKMELIGILVLVGKC